MTDARQIRIQWAALAVVSCICLITAGQGCNELDDFPGQPDFDLYLNQPLKAPSKDCQHTGRVIWAIICGGLSTILSLAFLVAAPKLSQNANKAIGLFFLSWWTAGVGVLAFMNDRVAQPGWGVLSNGFASIWLAYLFSVRLNLLLWVSPSDAVSPPSSSALGASRDSFAILFATSAALLVQLSKDCDMKLGGKCTAEFGYALAVPVVSFLFCLVTLVANHKGDAQSVTAVRWLSAFFFTWWALAFGILTLKDNATGVTVIRVYPQNVGVAWFSLWGALLSSTFLVAGVFIAEDTKKQPAGKDAAPPAADEAPDATQSATPQVESYAA